MARTSGELQLQAQKLGLPTNGTRDQLMDRIRDFFVHRDGVSILPQISVMTAQNAKDALDYDLERPWTSQKLMDLWYSPEWVVEPKLDGVRVKAHFHPTYEVNPRLDSRRRSDVNFLYNEATYNFPHLRLENPPEDTILDGEMMPPPGVTKMWNGVLWVEGLNITTSIWNSGPETAINLQGYAYREDCKTQGVPLHYHAFDILRHRGEWLVDRPYEYRRIVLHEVIAEIRKTNQYYHHTPLWYTNSSYAENCGIDWGSSDQSNRLFQFEKLIEQGGEGVMFKHLKSPYEINKRSWSWLKLKKFQTIDAVIIGSVPATEGKAWEGLIGAFEVACYSDTGEPVHVASCSAMPLELRREATGVDGRLRQDFLGKVIEVRFQCMTMRSARGRHAVMIRFRPDKNPHECTLDQIIEAKSEVMEG